MSADRDMVSLAREYLTYRHSLGIKLKSEGPQLLRFAEFADLSGHVGAITTDLALTWAQLPRGTSRLYHVKRLDIVRSFARYRAIFDRDTEVPPYRLITRGPRRSQPHIYSDEEIRQLMQAAKDLTPKARSRSLTYWTLFGLLVSTGLRLQEALRLRGQDINFETGVVAIVETKFYKSRLIVLHPTSVARLLDYVRFRDSEHPDPQNDAFFVSAKGVALNYSAVRMTFVRICHRLKWEPSGQRPRPRLYDLRHTFACRRLLKWYREGTDVDNAIVSLSTYMGHTKVTDTYWYLTGIPELMQIATERFEGYAHSNTEKIQ
jgi:integrase